jgi:hypothetical protein
VKISDLGCLWYGSNILQFVTIPAMGLSMSVSTLVSQNIGAGNIQRAARVTYLGAVSGFIILTLTGIVAYFFAPAFVAFFVPGDSDVIAQGTRFIRILPGVGKGSACSSASCPPSARPATCLSPHRTGCCKFLRGFCCCFRWSPRRCRI